MSNQRLTALEKLTGLAALVVTILFGWLVVKYILWIIEIINKLVDWIITK